MEKPTLYAQANTAVSRGDKLTAKNLLDELVVTDPVNEKGWLLLSTVTEDPEEIEKCLRQVLEINPGNLTASKRLFKIVAEKEKKNPPVRQVTEKASHDYSTEIILFSVFYAVGILSAQVVMLIFLFIFVCFFLYKVYSLIKKVFIEKKESFFSFASGWAGVRNTLLLVFVQWLVYWNWNSIAPILRGILWGFVGGIMHSKKFY